MCLYVSPYTCLSLYVYVYNSMIRLDHMVSLQITSLPLLLVNSRDDPLVKECLLSIANDYTSKCVPTTYTFSLPLSSLSLPIME